MWSLGTPRIAATVLALIALVCSAGCDRPDPRPHESLDDSLTALREQFNADADRTRILMIVAPT